MRVLGPNPRAGLAFATQVAQKRASVLAASGNPAHLKLEERVTTAGKRAAVMLAMQDGSASIPEHAGMASFFAGTRAVLTSVQLGSAILSSTTDLATIGVAAKIAGMNPTNVFARAVGYAASHATRETAARMGYVAGALADAGASHSRFIGGVLGSGWPQKLAGFTMRASGLSFWTDMNRTAFKMEFSGFLADNAARAFADIDAPLRKIFERRGITAADWDHLRDPSGRFVAAGGEDFISPTHWLEHQTRLPRAEASGLAMRLSMAIEEQLEFAVPTSSLEGRAMWVRGEAGTLGGELLRSSFMYKGFVLSLMLNHYRRFMSIPTTMGRVQYAATLGAGLFVMGALAVQLKELAKGRDPRPMTDRRFWMAALFQSGGLGIFGDFFSSTTSRTGGGLAETLAGPVVGLFNQGLRVVNSNVSRAANGEKTSWGRDAANFVRFNTPLFSSLWYARAPFDRMIADQVQFFFDPEADVAWRRQEKQREKDFGNTTFWNRGELGPSRLPNFGNVAGGAR